MTLTVGTLLNNRYRISSVLGQGGMGSVYHAYDENLRIDVAVKENLFLTDEYARQFQLEASILAGMRHPNLPRMGDHFMIPGQGQYMVMDYIGGEDLRQRLERLTCIPEQEVIMIGAVICDALSYLHNRPQPVIHRDIKPGNIKITPEGEIYLVDFGLAKVMQDSQSTTTGARAMTPGYSPPEQYGIAHTDSRSDIYSLGATLYASLTGIIPEDGLARATGKTQLTPPTQLQPKISRRISAVIEKAMAVEPEDRYQTAEEFQQALLQAGEISHLPQGKILISPPPLSGDLSPEGLGVVSAEVAPLKPQSAQAESDQKKPLLAKTRFLSKRWITTIVLLLVLGCGLLFAVTGTRARATNYFHRFMAIFVAERASPTVSPSPNIALSNVPAATKKAKATATKPVKLAATLTSSPAHSLTPLYTSTPSLTPTASETPTIAPTLIGGGTGEMAYSSQQDGTTQVWLMDSSGNQLSKITNLSGGACQASWAPDGNQLAFISPCDGRHDIYEGAQIYIINADGTNLHLLPVPNDAQGDFDPAWSPDGKKIAFTSLRGGSESTHIFMFDLTNSSLTQITNTHLIDRQPFWDPDSSHLAFVRLFLFAQIWWVDLADPGKYIESQFSPYNEFSDYWPTWSPDGQWVLYSQVQPGSNPFLVGLVVSNRTYDAERRIRPGGPDMSYPIAEVNISPDGSLLAFESWPDGLNHDIYVMDFQGGNLRRLTQDPGTDFGPAWRPGIKKP